MSRRPLRIMNEIQWQEARPINQGWRSVRDFFLLRPIVWFLQIYEKCWAARFRRIPDNHEIARRVRGESPMDAPLPLPKRRERALTNPLPPMNSNQSLAYNIRRSRQITEDQSASAFITKLPPEVRRLIYEQVLAGGEHKVVHILRKHGRLGHWRCRMQNAEVKCEAQSKRCVEGWLLYKERNSHWRESGRLDLVTDSGLLPLLFTCRFIYSEAVPILYSSNVFHFYDPGDIRHFARTTLPQRLNAIQSVLIDWERPFSIFNKNNSIPKQDDDELKAWRETWEILAKIENLTEVRVSLKKHKFVVSDIRRKTMCREMMKIHGLRIFDLVIPSNNNNDWSFASNAPFRIIKPPDTHTLEHG